MNDNISESPRKKKRRSLNRLRTADFIWQMDALTIVVVVFTAYAKVDGWTGLGQFPWSIMMLGVAVLFIRMGLLMTLNGTGYQILSNVANFVGRSMTEKSNFEFQWSAGAKPLEDRKGGPLGRPTRIWFFLVFLGIVALIAIVGSSGGITSSPFWEILLATFIIGQFRAPTGMGIWALFWFGLLATAAAQVVYQLLYNSNPKSFAMMHFGITFYIAPLLLVLFISTLVSYVTFSTEPDVLENITDVVNDRPVGPLMAEETPGDLLVAEDPQGDLLVVEDPPVDPQTDSP